MLRACIARVEESHPVAPTPRHLAYSASSTCRRRRRDPSGGSDTPVRRVVSRVSDSSDTRVEESLRQAPTPPNYIFFRRVDVSVRLLRLRSRKIAAPTFDSSDRALRVACCGARHPTGALMSLSDAICQELARAHHEKLIALKERSWLNPNLIAKRAGQHYMCARSQRALEGGWGAHLPTRSRSPCPSTAPGRSRPRGARGAGPRRVP